MLISNCSESQLSHQAVFLPGVNTMQETSSTSSLSVLGSVGELQLDGFVRRRKPVPWCRIRCHPRAQLLHDLFLEFDRSNM